MLGIESTFHALYYFQEHMHFCPNFVLLNILILNQYMLLAVLNFKAENAYIELILTVASHFVFPSLLYK